MHLGHAYSALLAFDAAQAADGRFILRIEDIDKGRCRPNLEQAIYEDLAWLGIAWDEPVRRQSDHFSDYQIMLDNLKRRGLVYPCFCTRADIAAEVARSPSAPHGPDGVLYPGTCRALSTDEQKARIAAGEAHAWRLDTAKALETVTRPLMWFDQEKGEVLAHPLMLGDVVLARKDTPTSYHLSVTHDDALQGITHIIRGTDLFHATHIHVLLQALMGWPTPIYHHHRLIMGEDGKRLAKRDKAMTLKVLRECGLTSKTVRAKLGLRTR